MQKWLSRKLLVAVVSVVAIAMGIAKGDPDVEVGVQQQGELVVTAAITLVSVVYMVMQGLADKKDDTK